MTRLCQGAGSRDGLGQRLWFVFPLTMALLMFFTPVSKAGRVLHETVVTKPFQPKLWQQVLTESVTLKGDVDFDKLKLGPRQLVQYMDQLKAVSPVNHPDYFNSLDDVATYWVNAHNALALRLILDRYPADSAKKIPNFMTDRRYLIGGVPTSLSDIETLIGQRFNHYPGIFFAITTLTRDAPPLLPEAYQGVTLEKQLKRQASRYLQDKTALSTFSSAASEASTLSGSNTCLGIRLGGWFQTVTPGLQQAMQFKYPAHGPWSQAETLASVVKPYLSPSDHALMNVHCPHPVQIRAANPVFRRPEK